MKRNIIILTGLAIIFFMIIMNDKDTSNAIYKQNSNMIYDGSIYYNYEQCALCHGIQYDGNGPNAQALYDERQLKISSFVNELSADKTYLDYFQSLSVGTKAMPDHTFMQYTDRGRWAMAYFLYSLGKLPESKQELSNLKLKLVQTDRIIQELYQGQQRFARLVYKHPFSEIRDLNKIPKIKENNKK